VGILVLLLVASVWAVDTEIDTDNMLEADSEVDQHVETDAVHELKITHEMEVYVQALVRVMIPLGGTCTVLMDASGTVVLDASVLAAANAIAAKTAYTGSQKPLCTLDVATTLTANQEKLRTLAGERADLQDHTAVYANTRTALSAAQAASEAANTAVYQALLVKRAANATAIAANKALVANPTDAALKAAADAAAVNATQTKATLSQARFTAATAAHALSQQVQTARGQVGCAAGACPVNCKVTWELTGDVIRGDPCTQLQQFKIVRPAQGTGTACPAAGTTQTVDVACPPTTPAPTTPAVAVALRGAPQAT